MDIRRPAPLFSPGRKGPKRRIRTVNVPALTSWWRDSGCTQNLRSIISAPTSLLYSNNNTRPGQPVFPSLRRDSKVTKLKYRATSMRLNSSILSGWGRQSASTVRDANCAVCISHLFLKQLRRARTANRFPIVDTAWTFSPKSPFNIFLSAGDCQDLFCFCCLCFLISQTSDCFLLPVSFSKIDLWYILSLVEPVSVQRGPK